MLLYHPAFDIYHGIFRMLRLLERLPRVAVEIERLRILDFYLLFPAQIQYFTFPTEIRGYRRQLSPVENPYEQINDPKRIFFRLEPYQTCALKSLAAHQFINSESFCERKALRTDKPLPDGLREAVKPADEASAVLLEFLTGPLLKMDFYGKSGLKGRSDLFEYRYDFANSPAGA
jgi:hypothetical protein